MAYVSKSIVRWTFYITSVHAHNAYAIALKSRLHCICVYFKISMCMHVRNVIFNTGSVRTGHFFCRTPFRKLVGKMFLVTRVAFLDSPTIAEIVYVIFNLVARLMLDLNALQETRFAISRSSRGRKFTFSQALFNKFYCAFMLSLFTNRDHSE